jgi:hypothetical protein
MTTTTQPRRPVLKGWPPGEKERRAERRAADLKAARWIFALAWCGLNEREIAHVLNIRDLSKVRAPLYGSGWYMYGVKPPARVSDEIRELWKDETNMPPGLKEALAKQDARQQQ